MKIVIVGGVAGGASCATRARRLNENAEIVIFERGDNVSYANCGLPYFVGGAIAKEESLTVASPGFLRARFAIDVRVRSEVVGIDPAAKKVRVREREGREYEESYDKLVLAPGASAKTFGWGGEGVFTLRDVRDATGLSSYIREHGVKTALVAGGGFIGVVIGYLGTVVAGKLTLNILLFPSVGMTIGAVAFSVLLGVIFGMYPAIKASGLQPVEALRAD